MRLRLLLLWLVVSVCSYGQISIIGVSGRNKKTVAPTEVVLSAPSFASGGNYQSGREYYIYKPRGYDQAAAGSLPLMLAFPGYGVRDTWANRVNSGEGIYYYLNNGSWDDLTYGHIVVYCQYTTGDTDPNTGHFDDILTELDAEGIKYDPDRISYTGLSGGAIGAYNTLQGRYSQIASVITIAGPSYTSGWANYYGIGFWQTHGTADGTFGRTIGGSLYWANGDFSAWREETPAPRSTYYYGEGHSSSVWNAVYNPSGMTFNLFQFAAKFSKDAEQQATLFTDNAEATEDIVDYQEALQQVNALSSGAPKTALLARLATLLTTINKGGVRYYISPQTSGLGAIDAAYNIWTSFATGNGITNITDVGGGASTIDVTMTQECAASSRDGSASANNAGRQKSHGEPDYRVNLQGFVVNNAVNNGVVTISGIPSGKLTDVIIYHHHLAANDDSGAFSANNRLSVTCNSETQTQYSAYANEKGFYFVGVPESSGSFTIGFDAIDSRDCLVVKIELLVYTP